jgi:hypothetical protein
MLYEHHHGFHASYLLSLAAWYCIGWCFIPRSLSSGVVNIIHQSVMNVVQSWQGDDDMAWPDAAAVLLYAGSGRQPRGIRLLATLLYQAILNHITGTIN